MCANAMQETTEELNRQRIEMGQRIREVALEKFGTKIAAGSYLGVSPETMLNYFDGKTRVPFEVIMRLSAATGVSMSWIWSGEGEKYLEAAASSSGAMFLPDIKNVEETDDYSIERALKSLIDLWGIPLDMAAYGTVTGDGMSPTLSDGDVVVVDRSHTDHIETDQIYVFRVFGEVLIRRLERRGEQLVIKCDNSRYGASTLAGGELEHFEWLGKVQAVMRKL